jgi:hypothetical protein
MPTMNAPGVRHAHNLYQGVNAHLHSLFQAQGGWASFHTLHIAHLLVALKARLLPLGYTAVLEDSLQLRRADDSTARPQSDITIYDTPPWRSTADTARSTGALTLPLLDVLDENPPAEAPYRAVAIYPLNDKRAERPVAWLELLSPSNKGSGDDAQRFRLKRHDLIEAQLVWIELDYLHSTPPTFARLPDYTRGAPDAQPYRIIVIDPRPRLSAGRLYLSNFAVDAPIPTVELPLNADTLLSFDFDAPYQRSYSEALYGLELVDYAAPPIQFERYSAADRERIRAVMARAALPT